MIIQEITRMHSLDVMLSIVGLVEDEVVDREIGPSAFPVDPQNKCTMATK